jgi:hypothetical protein
MMDSGSTEEITSYQANKAFEVSDLFVSIVNLGSKSVTRKDQKTSVLMAKAPHASRFEVNKWWSIIQN